MRPTQDIPTTVLQDKERLADYILARSPRCAPVATPPVRKPRQGVVVINFERIREWAVRPTAMTVSTALHATILLGLLCWSGLRDDPEPHTTYSITFDGSMGEVGDGQEAGGSGSAPVLGPDLSEVQAPSEPVPAVQPSPSPDPVPAAPMPSPVPDPAAVPASVPALVGEKAGGGGGHAASGGTQGAGHGGTGGGLFGARFGRGKGLGLGGGTPASEASVALGLRWLADHQEPNGSWGLEAYARHCPAGDSCRGATVRLSGVYDVGGTGLALLAFLGAGHTPFEGEHREVVSRAASWLEGRQASDGSFGSTFDGMMYNHGIATLALAELYAMTRDERAGEAAQKGIRFLERAQQAAGGWDYSASPTGRNDTSITGWQVMALKSAQASGLEVSPGTVLKAMAHFVRMARPDGETAYADREPGTGRIGEGMAAVGLASRIFLGWPRNAPAIRESARRCLKTLPEWGAWTSRRWDGPYSWYYATMGLFQVGGDAWATWNARIRDLLVEHQAREGHQAGSWPGEDHVTNLGGRLVATSLNLLTLEVYYRYLPLYEQGEGSAVERMLDALPEQGQLTAAGIVAREFDRDTAVAVLRHGLGTAKSEEVRLDEACRLLALGDDAGAAVMAGASDRLSGIQAVKAASALLPARHPMALPLLERALGDPNPFTRFSAVRVLAESGEDGAAGLLRRALGDPDPPVRRRAEEALAALGGRKDDPPPAPAAPKAPAQDWSGMRLAEVLLALEPSTRDPGELAAARGAYAALLEEARQAVGKGAEPLRAVELLNRHLYEVRGFSSLPPGAGDEAIHLADTLRTKRANCVGLSGLYLALAEDLGLELKVVSTPTHCFLRLEAGTARRNIEATDAGKDVPDAEYPRLLEDPGLKAEALRSAPREAYLAAFLNSRGAARSRRREYEAALGDFNLSLVLDPGHVSALSNRGNCLRALGRWEEAERDFARSLEREAAWLPALLGKAAALLERGQAEPARAALEKAVETHPGAVRALTALGEFRRRHGDLDGALALSERSLELDPKDALALALKGSVLYQKGDPAGAESALAAAMSLNPEDAAIRVQLGRLYCGQRRWDDAVAQLEKAVLCDRGVTEARTLLDYAREKSGK